MKFSHPDEALLAIARRLATTAVERAATKCVGRVLAQSVVADRDSPAADVSAMDGYAVRMSDLASEGALAIVGESACGKAPPKMPDDGVLRIFTGAIVPAGSEAVIKREDTIESEESILLSDQAKQVAAGSNIRRVGENLSAGNTVFDKGVLITPATRAALVNFGHNSVDTFAPVRVSIITTGDEVVSLHASPEPWQLRNSNLHSLVSMCEQQSWIEVKNAGQCEDEKSKLEESLRQSLDESDAVVMTGGVSMGDYDFVPDVVRNVGGNVIFHGLPIRPGKPILGAVTDEGKLIIGLPGNPVSAVVNARRMVMPLLARMSGLANWLAPMPRVQVVGMRDRMLPLYQMLLVRINQQGQAEMVPSKGSGDLVALGKSDGFIEVPPKATDDQLRPFFCW